MPVSKTTEVLGKRPTKKQKVSEEDYSSSEEGKWFADQVKGQR
jgi:hypothetical protein